MMKKVWVRIAPALPLLGVSFEKTMLSLASEVVRAGGRLKLIVDGALVSLPCRIGAAAFERVGVQPWPLAGSSGA